MSGMPLYLSALGIISPLGRSSHDVLTNLLAGHTSGMIINNNLHTSKAVITGTITYDISNNLPLDHIYYCRNNLILISALNQIKNNIDELIDRVGRNRIAVVLGSSTSGIFDGEIALQHKVTHGAFPIDYHYQKQEMGSAARFLANYLNLSNIAVTISTACTSSAKAFASAQRFIECGLCDAAIVGGVDSLARLTVNGFSALESLSPDICNPFSKNRSGINIGEGAALFILEKKPSQIRLLGTGESSDAYHMSAPQPEGLGAEQAMMNALVNASITNKHISYVNLHGTATIKNDDMEAKAMNRVFPNYVKCSSTKPLTGHTLGAAGAIEIAHCWLTLTNSTGVIKLPPHIWDNQEDPSIPRLNFAQPDDSIGAMDATIFMSNTFAFGGSNVSLIIGSE